MSILRHFNEKSFFSLCRLERRVTLGLLLTRTSYWNIPRLTGLTTNYQTLCPSFLVSSLFGIFFYKLFAQSLFVRAGYGKWLFQEPNTHFFPSLFLISSLSITSPVCWECIYHILAWMTDCLDAPLCDGCYSK